MNLSILFEFICKYSVGERHKLRTMTKIETQKKMHLDLFYIIGIRYIFKPLVKIK